MRTTMLLFTFLTFFLQVKSQDSEVEIYLMQNNLIVKGKLLESSNDSVRIMVDSVTTLAFAKSELEGKELPVSKEVKKLRKKLMRDESKETMRLYPGIYQMRNGEKVKGKIMFVVASIGILGVFVSGGILLVGLSTVKGLGALIYIIDAFIGFEASTLFYGIGNMWSLFDHWHTIKKLVESRYYYRGVISSTK